jgi:broad specificity phosphatase PhoE
VGDLVLVRHGQTEWSASGQHTSYTDIDLTADGERQARALADALRGRRIAAVLCSPRKRAIRTADLAGLTVSEVDDDLAEWNYGRYEGLTTDQIQVDSPQWNLWVDGAPGGESPDQIQQRIDRVLARVQPLLARGDVVLAGHGHALRVVGARWIELPASAGGKLRLDTATVSVLGYEHGRRVVLLWNMPAIRQG